MTTLTLLLEWDRHSCLSSSILEALKCDAA
jgi:hypothetical protein